MISYNKYNIINNIYMILHMKLDNIKIFSYCNNVEYIIYILYMSIINNNIIHSYYSYSILLFIFIHVYLKIPFETANIWFITKCRM